MNEILSTVILTIVGSMTTWALGSLRNYVAKKTKNEAINAAMERVTNTAQTVVDNMTQTIVTDMKANGLFGPKSSSVAKKRVVDEVMKQLPSATIKIIESAVTDLPGFIGQKVEQAVLRGKSR